MSSDLKIDLKNAAQRTLPINNSEDIATIYADPEYYELTLRGSLTVYARVVVIEQHWKEQIVKDSFIYILPLRSCGTEEVCIELNSAYAEVGEGETITLRKELHPKRLQDFSQTKKFKTWEERDAHLLTWGFRYLHANRMDSNLNLNPIFENAGSSCFLNSALQLMLHTPVTIAYICGLLKYVSDVGKDSSFVQAQKLKHREWTFIYGMKLILRRGKGRKINIRNLKGMNFREIVNDSGDFNDMDFHGSMMRLYEVLEKCVEDMFTEVATPHERERDIIDMQMFVNSCSMVYQKIYQQCQCGFSSRNKCEAVPGISYTPVRYLRNNKNFRGLMEFQDFIDIRMGEAERMPPETNYGCRVPNCSLPKTRSERLINIPSILTFKGNRDVSFPCDEVAAVEHDYYIAWKKAIDERENYRYPQFITLPDASVPSELTELKRAAPLLFTYELCGLCVRTNNATSETHTPEQLARQQGGVTHFYTKFKALNGKLWLFNDTDVYVNKKDGDYETDAQGNVLQKSPYKHLKPQGGERCLLENFNNVVFVVYQRVAENMSVFPVTEQSTEEDEIEEYKPKSHKPKKHKKHKSKKYKK